MNLEKRNLPKRKIIRLKNYDYTSEGYYFVTVCSFDKQANINLYSGAVERILLSLPSRFSGLRIDYYSLLPTHLHVIFVFEQKRTTLGQVIRSFKALVSKETGKKNFWQRNYYEHVIRNETALLKIREYIQNNPLIEKIKFEQFYKL